MVTQALFKYLRWCPSRVFGKIDRIGIKLKDVVTVTLEELYRTMAHEMGPQPWLRPGTPWAETPVEIMLGAILVQNTN